jgi:hypothetical protein
LKTLPFVTRVEIIPVRNISVTGLWQRCAIDADLIRRWTAARTVINLRTAVDGTVGHEQILESLRLVFLAKILILKGFFGTMNI